jgi:RNA polymerase sigma-70 factor (ECF subfamily)
MADELKPARAGFEKGTDPDRRETVWIRLVVLQDDHEAFGELVRLHQSAVRQFLRRLTGDAAEAEDLAQETFWRAYRNLASYEGRGRFLGWLFRLAYQLFVSARRGAGRVRCGGALAEVPLPDELPDAGDAGQRLAERRTFDQLMDLLRPEERAAVVLHYRHELTHPEIAEALELPLGTVKTLIRRARLRLQEAMEAGRETSGPRDEGETGREGGTR